MAFELTHAEGHTNVFSSEFTSIIRPISEHLASPAASDRFPSQVVCAVLAAAAAVGSASVLYGSPLGYSAVGYGSPLGYSALGYGSSLGYGAVLSGRLPYAAVAPAAVSRLSQSHSQDELGQYAFDYNAGSSARSELKTADGVVRGSYSYVDANGLPQKVSYVADALGFRTVGTNLPVAGY